MKKISKLLFVLVTVSISLLSCVSYEDAPNTVPVISAPKVLSVTESTVTFDKGYSYGYLLISRNSDMSDCTEYGETSYVKGLSPNTTYYAQYVIYDECYDKGELIGVKSPITEFQTSAYAPTAYTIKLSNTPSDGNYGVFTVDANGLAKYESVKYGSVLYPSTKITGPSTIYLTSPYISGASDPKAVRIYRGTDFYYASGAVTPDSPSLTLAPKRFTANVNVNVTFKAAKEEAENVKLTGLTIANVDGNTPLCNDGLLNLATGEFTPSESAGSYYNNTSTSISSGKTVSRTFYGVLPVKFGDNAVKVVLSLSGDINEKEVSVVLPASTWSEGSDVKINLNAEYTASGVELYIGYVEVIPWGEGSTGNIDITK